VRQGWEGCREVGWDGGIEGGRAFSKPPRNMAGWLMADKKIWLIDGLAEQAR